jgi:hypothetical protein
MNVLRALIAGLAALTLAAPVCAQEVETSALAAPGLFSIAARPTDLPGSLWNGASVETIRTVLPLIAVRPLSPAARALAVKVLATGAATPPGLGRDLDLVGARIGALLAQGDLVGARTLIEKTPGIEQSPVLSRAAAEANLLSQSDPAACTIGQDLTSGREDIYWLRLRTYCQALAGQIDAASLTLELAQGQQKDAIFGRLISAKLAGGGDPGGPSLRNGLDYALSRNLGLDLSKAEPAPAVALALAPPAIGPAVWQIESGPGAVRTALALAAAGELGQARAIRSGLTQDEIPNATITDLALLDGVLAAAEGRADGQTLDRLIERGVLADAKTRPRVQTASLILAALGAPMSPRAAGEFATFTAGETRAPPARALALDLAADQKLTGQAALLALWISVEAGPGGPAPGDRVRIIRALRSAGLEADARAFAVEGLLAVR